MAHSVSVLRDLEAVTPAAWRVLAERSHTDTSTFLTPQWQLAWWGVFGRGQLVPVVVSRADRPVFLAPIFVDGGMAFFVGSGGSDYLDFVGDTTDAEVMTLALAAVLETDPGLLGFRLYHVPDDSPTGATLRSAAENLGLTLVDEGSLVAPRLDIAGDAEHARGMPEKKSLVRHERWFRNAGDLHVERRDDAAGVLPHLDEFFDQHVQRWSMTDHPSQFSDPRQREFFRAIVVAGAEAGWLRFTRVVFDGQMIAAHLGFCHRGVFLWYKPTFDPEFAKRSPGEVLLRSLLLDALADGTRTFDFGLGDEPFKQRFATAVRTVRTWGLYPPGAGG